MTQTYLNEDTYQALVAALLRAAQHPDAQYAVVEALGEIGGVWPDSVKEDPLFVA
jgi:hypothetical protein